jgi:hypothetical protein
VWCSLWGTDWIPKYYLEELCLRRTELHISDGTNDEDIKYVFIGWGSWAVGCPTFLFQHSVSFNLRLSGFMFCWYILRVLHSNFYNASSFSFSLFFIPFTDFTIFWSFGTFPDPLVLGPNCLWSTERDKASCHRLWLTCLHNIHKIHTVNNLSAVYSCWLKVMDSLRFISVIWVGIRFRWTVY